MHTAVNFAAGTIIGLLLAVAAGSIADDREDNSAKQRHQKFPRQRLALEEFPWNDERLKPPGPPRPGVTTIYLHGYGTTFDPAAMRELRPGAHYTEPSNAPHFASSGSEGAVVECTAHGPSGTTFVNPADQ